MLEVVNREHTFNVLFKNTPTIAAPQGSPGRAIARNTGSAGRVGKASTYRPHLERSQQARPGAGSAGLLGPTSVPPLASTATPVPPITRRQSVQ